MGTSLHLPNTIRLLECIIHHLEPILSILKNKNDEIIYFKTLIKNNTELNKDPSFITSEERITFLQILMLVSLSMYGGIHIPCIKQFTSTTNTVRICWDTGLIDQFNFGVYNNDFIHFAHSYQNRLSSTKLKKRHIASNIFRGIYQFLFSYKKILIECNQRFEKIITPSQPIEQILKNNEDLLFLVISSLPTDQINTLFIYLQQFLPDDLKVKSQSGNTISVKQLFQSSASNYNFLMEKNNAYLELFYDHKKPIIKEITHIKTIEFLSKKSTNHKINTSLKDELKKTKAQQIDFRLSLLNLFIPTLDKICG
ncbi:MAG: hypothetical protein VW378_03620 [bacterium]